MPFLPLVILLAGQAISRSASFLLGWAIADSAPITSDEWDVPYRLRLQMEREARSSDRR